MYSCYIFNLGARWGWVVNTNPGQLYDREGEAIPILQGAEWAPGLFCSGAKNIALRGIGSPDSPRVEIHTF
jgi:hypothetical protein